MNVFLKLSRMAVVLLVGAFLAACSQTTTSGVSSYGGKLGSSSKITDKKRQTKILAARKRAKAKRAARHAAFAAKRKARLKAYKKTKRKSTRKSTKVSKRNRKKLSKKRLAKRVKHRIRKVTKRRHSKKRTKRSTYAYVGGRSKGIRRSSPWRCVPGRLKRVISQISRKYGRVTVNSTHRSRRYNRRVGGKRRSYHLRCRAVDFRVHGRTRGLTRWLARHPLVGGYKRYRSGFYHIDNGPRRTW